MPFVSPFDESYKSCHINILESSKALLSFYHGPIDVTVQRLREAGDEIGVDIERFAFDDEFEGSGGIDTGRRVREFMSLDGEDNLPLAPIRHDIQLERMATRSLLWKQGGTAQCAALGIPGTLVVVQDGVVERVGWR